MPLLDCSLPEKPPFFSPVHWRQRAGSGETADGIKQGFAPKRSYPNRSSTSTRKTREKPNPPLGVVRRIQTKASEATRRGFGTRCPCRRRGVLRSFRLQSALLPLSRVTKREERSWKWNMQSGKGEEGERPAIQ